MNPKLPRGAVSWAFYDLANTIYSMNVVTLFFSQWVTVDRGRQDLWFSSFYGVSMLLVAFTLPYLGLWSDRARHRLRFLGGFTTIAVIATGALAGLTRLPGTPGLIVALMVFALSNYAYQGALVFYNALLPVVSTPDNQGKVSGLGVGLGYVGSLLGMLLAMPFVAGRMPILGIDIPWIHAGGRTAAFLPTAVLFAAFSLPLFLRVREPPASPAPRPRWNDAARELIRTLADAARYPGVRRFLLANFLILDAVHTVIVFMAVYAQKVMGLPDTAKVTFFMLATLPAMGGAAVSGWLADRFGSRRVFLVTAWLWVLCPLAVAVTHSLVVFYTAGGAIGFLLGALWTTTRPLLLSLTPEGDEGKLFGLYAFSNKTAAVVGPQLWGVTVLVAAPLGTARYRLAIAVLAGVAATGAILLHRVRERPCSREVAPDPESSAGT